MGPSLGIDIGAAAAAIIEPGEVIVIVKRGNPTFNFPVISLFNVPADMEREQK